MNTVESTGDPVAVEDARVDVDLGAIGTGADIPGAVKNLAMLVEIRIEEAEADCREVVLQVFAFL